jgi:hypothetical protein
MIYSACWQAWEAMGAPGWLPTHYKQKLEQVFEQQNGEEKVHPKVTSGDIIGNPHSEREGGGNGDTAE